MGIQKVDPKNTSETLCILKSFKLHLINDELKKWILETRNPFSRLGGIILLVDTIPDGFV